MPARRSASGESSRVLRGSCEGGQLGNHPDVIIDRSHRGWFIGSVLMLAQSVAVYIPYLSLTVTVACRGRVLGLIFTSAGAGMMVFLSSLRLRKTTPLWL